MLNYKIRELKSEKQPKENKLNVLEKQKKDMERVFLTNKNLGNKKFRIRARKLHNQPYKKPSNITITRESNNRNRKSNRSE